MSGLRFQLAGNLEPPSNSHPIKKRHETERRVLPFGRLDQCEIRYADGHDVPGGIVFGHVKQGPRQTTAMSNNGHVKQRAVPRGGEWKQHDHYH